MTLRKRDPPRETHSVRTQVTTQTCILAYRQTGWGVHMKTKNKNSVNMES